jgi:hypothetical protein
MNQLSPDLERGAAIWHRRPAVEDVHATEVDIALEKRRSTIRRCRGTWSIRV